MNDQTKARLLALYDQHRSMGTASTTAIRAAAVEVARGIPQSVRALELALWAALDNRGNQKSGPHNLDVL